MTIVVIIQYATRGKVGDLGTHVAVTASGRQEGGHAGQEDHRRGHRPAGFGKPGEQKLGYQTPDDLLAAYPAFFWKAVCPSRYAGRSSGSPTSMRTCSRKSTGEHLGATGRASTPAILHADGFGSEADILTLQNDVRSTPNNGHGGAPARRPLRVTCGRRPGKNFLTFCSIGRVRSRVRPVDAAGMAAGPNALRGSGPKQKRAL
jgi:hypothetical protein